MRKKVYSVALSADEQARLRELTKKGKLSARKLSRAHILLASHAGKTDAEIAETLHVCISTVGGTRKRFAQEGLDRGPE